MSRTHRRRGDWPGWVHGAAWTTFSLFALGVGAWALGPVRALMVGAGLGLVAAILHVAEDVDRLLRQEEDDDA